MIDRDAFRNGQLVLDGKPTFLRGGEIHYFRMPAAIWRDRLQKAVEGGLNTVTSYMPWFFHEPAEGEIDLTGASLPERDLKRFLDLVAESGLKLMARPGPFVNSELRAGGFPTWLFRNHPETLSRRADGTHTTGRPIPAEGEPVYRQHVRRWYETIVPLIAEYDEASGGPLILFQPDNELSAAWSYGLLTSLYDPTILSRFWPDWLARTFGSMDAVNDRYGARYAAFSEIDPPRQFPAGPEDRNRCLDWMQFKRWFFADWGCTLAQWAREFGIRVPILFNEPVAGFYGHGDHAGFGAELGRRGLEVCTACHTYSDRILDLEGLVNLTLGVELVKSAPCGGPPLSVELNAGWYIPRLSRSAINWEPLLRAGMGRGLAGYVIYPYAAGTAPLDNTIDGPQYWEPSCLALDGSAAPPFATVARFNRFAASWEQPLTASRACADVTLAYTPGQRLLDFLGAPPVLTDDQTRPLAPGGTAFDTEPAIKPNGITAGHEWLDGNEGVIRQTVSAEAGVWGRTRDMVLLLQALNTGFDMLDLTQPNREPGCGCIVVACTGAMEREAVDFLLAHLQAGGRCLFFPTVPLHDLEGRPDRRVAELLGIRLQRRVPPAGGRPLDYGTRIITTDDGEPLGVNGWVHLYDVPTDARTIAWFENAPTAAVLSAGSSGRAVLAGLDASYTSYGSLAFWRQVLQTHLDTTPTVASHTTGCHALLRHGPQADFLTVINVDGHTGSTSLTVRPSARRDARGNDTVAMDVDLAPHEARCLVLNTTLDGAPLAYVTSELIRAATRHARWELHGRPGTAGTIAFHKPVRLDWNGTPRDAKPAENGLHVIRYRHTAEPVSIQVIPGFRP